MDIGHDTPISDGNVSKELAQLLVVPDCELNVSGYDSRLLIVPGSIAG